MKKAILFLAVTCILFSCEVGKGINSGYYIVNYSDNSYFKELTPVEIISKEKFDSLK